jgi:hypothetical protein
MRPLRRAQEPTVEDLAKSIRLLPSDRPVVIPGTWYRTQKEHWLGWLAEYGGPGAYGRRRPSPTSARSVYNRIVEPKMLLWLIRAAGIGAEVVAEAEGEVERSTSMMQASGRVRQVVPWDAVASALWGTQAPLPRRRRRSS